MLKASKQDVLNKKDDIQHVINIEHEEAEGEENIRLLVKVEENGGNTRETPGLNSYIHTKR